MVECRFHLFGMSVWRPGTRGFRTTGINPENLPMKHSDLTGSERVARPIARFDQEKCAKKVCRLVEVVVAGFMTVIMAT